MAAAMQRTNFNPLPPHGGRRVCRTLPASAVNFNPLPPHGGRRRFSVFLSAAEKSFQSTPSAWRETVLTSVAGLPEVISIHSLRMEGDHQD